MPIREAAMLPALVAALVQFILPFFTSLSPELAASINGAVALAASIVTAFLVSRDKGLAVLAGAGNAIGQLALGFGLHLTDAQMMLISTLLTLVTGAYTRTQVASKKPPVPVVETTDGRGNLIQVPNQAGGQL